jgi:serine/threonine protein kinase
VVVLRLAAGLAEGLTVIHAAGVVHRDLKPSNVLLADDGPRLIDFGISRSMETSALTQTGTVVGSPGFMSPEQTQGREVGPPSDIFSLGAVLTFAATGEGPFGHGTTVALLYRVVSSQPNTAGLPGALRLLAEHCLAKDPSQRPTAAQLLARSGCRRRPGRSSESSTTSRSRTRKAAGTGCRPALSRGSTGRRHRRCRPGTAAPHRRCRPGTAAPRRRRAGGRPGGAG